MRIYAGAPRAWHGPFGLPPLWSKPVPLRLSLPPCPSSFRTLLCHCEERAERRTRQSTACNGRVRAMRFAHRLTVDRHGLSALAMTRCERNGGVRFGSNTIFVIARKERSEGRGNPLGAMGAYGQCGSLPDSQWIATGFQPAR
jgi:hypothetical protein